MSSAISKTPLLPSLLQEKKALFPLSVQWTDTKITRVFLSAIAGYSLVGARVVAGGLFPMTIFSFATATPFVVLSLAILWYSTSLIDYENPTTLEQIKKTCEKLPLPEILAKHGWKNLFRFSLLDPKALSATYRAHAATLSFQEILNLYKESSKALCHTQIMALYQIPPPSEWRKKFFEETKTFTLEQILHTYSLSDLQTFEILTNEQTALLKAVSEAIDLEQKEFDMHVKTLSSLLEEKIEETLEYAHILKKAKSDLSHFPSCSVDGFEEGLKALFNLRIKEFQATKERTEASLKALHKSYNSIDLTRLSPKRA